MRAYRARACAGLKCIEGCVHDRIVHVFRDRISLRGRQRARRLTSHPWPRGAADHAPAQATIPLSMTEVQTDKDLLRAEFALSTRRLEMNVEQLKTESVSQLAELGRKGDAINRLKIELGTRSASCTAVALLSALDQSPGWTAAIDRITDR